MNDFVLGLLEKYRNKGILIDTNVLLLFIVGSLDPSLLPRFSRTAKYSFRDFQVIERTIDHFENKITTPHILTEVSNLINRAEIQMAVRSYVEVATEHTIVSSRLVAEKMFGEFGLADTAIANLAEDQFLVLTDDGPLTGLLSGRGVDVVNLNFLRH